MNFKQNWKNSKQQLNLNRHKEKVELPITVKYIPSEYINQNQVLITSSMWTKWKKLMDYLELYPPKCSIILHSDMFWNC
jgi:hypothetical protein